MLVATAKLCLQWSSPSRIRMVTTSLDFSLRKMALLLNALYGESGSRIGLPTKKRFECALKKLMLSAACDRRQGFNILAQLSLDELVISACTRSAEFSLGDKLFNNLLASNVLLLRHAVVDA